METYNDHFLCLWMNSIKVSYIKSEYKMYEKYTALCTKNVNFTNLISFDRIKTIWNRIKYKNLLCFKHHEAVLTE